jgi:hypothetical protein
VKLAEIDPGYRGRHESVRRRWKKASLCEEAGSSAVPYARGEEALPLIKA